MEEKKYNPFGSSINKVGRGVQQSAIARNERLESNGHRHPLAQPNARAERAEGGKRVFHGISRLNSQGRLKKIYIQRSI